eukprot:4457693-Pyramimonas_sp.AAC.2
MLASAHQPAGHHGEGAASAGKHRWAAAPRVGDGGAEDGGVEARHGAHAAHQRERHRLGDQRQRHGDPRKPLRARVLRVWAAPTEGVQRGLRGGPASVVRPDRGGSEGVQRGCCECGPPQSRARHGHCRIDR